MIGGEDKIRKAIGEANQKEEIGRTPPTIQEEGENESAFGENGHGISERNGKLAISFRKGGRRFRTILENAGARSLFQTDGGL